VTSNPRASVWLPLLAVILGVVVMVNVSVVVGMWVLAGLALAGAIARASGVGGTLLQVRRRVVDTVILAGFAVSLAFLATSGVLS
jgi:hypothetical protein